MMGSGGMVVMDESTCMVDVAKYFLDFLSGGVLRQVRPCRLGTDRMLEILTDITEGRGRRSNSTRSEDLAWTMADALAVRPGQDGAEPGALHAAVLPGRVRGAHQGQALPGRGLPGLIRYSIDPDALHAVRRLRRSLPARRDLRGRRSIASTKRCASDAASARTSALPKPSAGSEEAAMTKMVTYHGRRRADPGARGRERAGSGPGSRHLHPQPLPYARASAHRRLPGLHRRGGRGRPAQDDRVLHARSPRRAGRRGPLRSSMRARRNIVELLLAEAPNSRAIQDLAARVGVTRLALSHAQQRLRPLRPVRAGLRRDVAVELPGPRGPGQGPPRRAPLRQAAGPLQALQQLHPDLPDDDHPLSRAA